MPIQATRSNAKLPFVGAALAVFAILCCPAAVRAAGEDPWLSMFSVHGFGTAGLVHADAQDADFVGSPFQPNGAGYTRAWAPGVDSKAGLQVGARFTDQLSAVVQVVSQHLADNSWRPQVEWANLKYQPTPDLSIRAGRTVTSAFMLSDTRLVAYTYPWIRPPPELYAELPVTNLDGADASYHLLLGAVHQTVSVAYGQTILNLPGGGSVSAKHFLQANDVIELDALTLHVGYASLQVQTDIPSFDPLFAAFGQFGTTVSGLGFAAVGAQALSLDDLYTKLEGSAHAYSLVTVGASYNPQDWQFMAEWARSGQAGLLDRSTAWYVMGSRRFGQFTPYLTLAQVKANATVEPGILSAGLPAPLAAAAVALNDGITAAFRSFAPLQSTATAGLRWDLAQSIDLKLQYDRVRLGTNSIGRLENPQPGFRPGTDVNVISVAMDFVF
jgi:hypothetical protein